jgi:hypothetical protein
MERERQQRAEWAAVLEDAIQDIGYLTRRSWEEPGRIVIYEPLSPDAKILEWHGTPVLVDSKLVGEFSVLSHHHIYIMSGGSDRRAVREIINRAGFPDLEDFSEIF